MVLLHEEATSKEYFEGRNVLHRVRGILVIKKQATLWLNSHTDVIYMHQQSKL